VDRMPKKVLCALIGLPTPATLRVKLCQGSCDTTHAAWAWARPTPPPKFGGSCCGLFMLTIPDMRLP
jgi:hypothetical protein